MHLLVEDTDCVLQPEVVRSTVVFAWAAFAVAAEPAVHLEEDTLSAKVSVAAAAMA